MSALDSGFEVPAVSKSNLGRTEIPGWSVLLFVAGAVLVVAGCFFAPFLLYDDHMHVAGRAELQAGTGWSELFTQPFYGIYNPVTMLSYKLNFVLFGKAAWHFRLVDALIHAAGGWVLCLVLARLGLSRGEAIVGALIWCVHPMAVESVAWISQRQNVLAFFFGCSALWVWLEWRQSWKGVAAASMLFALALLSKPSALSFIPVLVVLEFFDPAYISGAKATLPPLRPRLSGMLRLLPLLALAGMAAKVSMVLAAQRITTPPGGSVGTALLTDTNIFARYILNFFAPVNLSSYYFVEDIVSLADARLWMWLAALTAMVGGSLALARSRRRALFGWLWFFGALAPNANLVGASNVMQDRYIYIASAGLVLVLIECAQGLFERVARAIKKDHRSMSGYLRTVAFGWVALLGLLAFSRSVIWADAFVLFSEAARKQPQSATPRYYLSEAMLILAKGARKRGEQAAPEGADALRTAIGLFLAAEASKDAYRYHDPLSLRSALALEALAWNQPNIAGKLLAGFAPPPASGPDGLSARSRRCHVRADAWTGWVHGSISQNRAGGMSDCISGSASCGGSEREADS